MEVVTSIRYAPIQLFPCYEDRWEYIIPPDEDESHMFDSFDEAWEAGCTVLEEQCDEDTFEVKLGYLGIRVEQITTIAPRDGKPLSLIPAHCQITDKTS